MINLKEAGRYSNYISRNLDEIKYSIATLKQNFIKVTETHKKSEAIQDLKDEVIEVEKETKYEIELKELEELLNLLLNEKARLSNAIFKAKNQMMITVDEKEYSFDTAIEMAIEYLKISNTFYAQLESFKNSKVKRDAYGRTFNVEGNQTSYQYPLEIETEVLIDLDEVKKNNKELKNHSNKLSLEIEEKSNLKVVDYETELNYLDNFDELIQKYSK